MRYRTIVLPALFVATAGCGEADPTTPSTCLLTTTTESTNGSLSLRNSADTTVVQQLAQSFELTSDTTISSLQVKLIRVGIVNSTMTLRIQGDNGGVPSGTDKGSGTFTLTTDATTGNGNISDSRSDFYAVTFTSTASITKNTLYWLRMEVAYSANSTAFIKWMGNDSNEDTKGQAFISTDGSNFTVFTGGTKDMLLKIGC